MLRLIFFISLLFSKSLFSQESSLIFNKFNLSIFNPAYTGIEGSAVNLNTRAQWIGLEDAPLTNYLIVHFPEKRNASIGLSIQNDRVFVENKTLLTFDYSDRLQLSDNSNISLGIKAGGMFFNVDTNNIPRIFTVPNESVSSLGNYHGWYSSVKVSASLSLCLSLFMTYSSTASYLTLNCINLYINNFK